MSISPVVNFKTSNNTAYVSDNNRRINRSPYFTSTGNDVYISSKKGKNANTGKWLLGIAAAGALVAGYLVFRKPCNFKLNSAQQAALNDLVSKGKLEEKDIKIMQKIYNKDNPEFLGYAMHEILSDMGYRKSVQPVLIIENDASGSSSWSPIKGITFSFKRLESDKGKNFVKADVFGSMRHELEHFHQSEMIYRAFGKEGLIDAEINKLLFNIKNSDDFCKKIFKKSYADVSKSELERFKLERKSSLGSDINTELFEKIEKTLGKIKKDTPEYKEAEAYLNATKEYASIAYFIKGKSISEIRQLPKETKDFLNKYYFNNLLENNAYKEGDAAEEKFKLFAQAVESNKDSVRVALYG